MSNGHQTGMRVRLTGGLANVDLVAKSVTAYGSSGWEFYLNANPSGTSAETFTIWLEYSDGTQASNKHSITTKPNNCNTNLAYVTFKQLQARSQ